MKEVDWQNCPLADGGECCRVGRSRSIEDHLTYREPRWNPDTFAEQKLSNSDEMTDVCHEATMNRPEWIAVQFRKYPRGGRSANAWGWTEGPCLLFLLATGIQGL